MESIKILSGKKYLIYGAGSSGKACKRFIKKSGGKPYLFSDADGLFAAPPEKDYALAVISPGIRPSHPIYEYCSRHGIKTAGEAQLGLENYDGEYIAVTGTNGKTTTTKLIAGMTGGTACGNIGYPITAALCDLADRPLVCELSSFQLKDAVISPNVAVITNMTADHLDYHGSEIEYYKSKCNIANNMNSGYLVLGDRIPLRALEFLNTNAGIVRCSVDKPIDGAYLHDGYFWFCGSRICPRDYLRLRGDHNVENALCAIAAAKCAGVDNPAILGALSKATPSPHRITDVGVFYGKRWIDDSKSTNVSSCLAAVAAVAESAKKICLIVGGRGKGFEFGELFDGLDDKVEIVAMGESALDIRAAAVYAGRPITVVGSLKDAVSAAAETDADTVLLSPACASFDEFKNYADRGDKFRMYVEKLGKIGTK